MCVLFEYYEWYVHMYMYNAKIWTENNRKIQLPEKSWNESFDRRWNFTPSKISSTKDRSNSLA